MCIFYVWITILTLEMQSAIDFFVLRLICVYDVYVEYISILSIKIRSLYTIPLIFYVDRMDVCAIG